MSETLVPDTLKSPVIFRGPDEYDLKTNKNIWFLSSNDDAILEDMVVEQPIGGTPELKSLSGRPATEEQLHAYLKVLDNMAGRAIVESLEDNNYDN